MVLLLGLLTLGCPAEDPAPPGRDLGPPRPDLGRDIGRDGLPYDLVSGPWKDKGIPLDLPRQPRDRCLDGKCAGGLICYQELCYTPCTQADPTCNDKSVECPPTEACRPAAGTDYVCFPAQPPGADCSNGKLCEGGSLCATTSGATLCRKLCKYGCGSLNCGKSPSGCDICF